MFSMKAKMGLGTAGYQSRRGIITVFRVRVNHGFRKEIHEMALRQMEGRRNLR
jgi:hypothetical protein